jgi:N utilization substance protein B
VARERALQALYQLEMTGGAPDEALEAAWAAEGGGEDPEAKSFALALVRGVHENLPDLDQLIESHSHNWRLDRMSRIDRNVLRLAAFELKHQPEVPKKVTLNEAVELGKRFGTSESSAFINGLLDRLAGTLGKS